MCSELLMTSWRVRPKAHITIAYFLNPDDRLKKIQSDKRASIAQQTRSLQGYQLYILCYSLQEKKVFMVPQPLLILG